MDAALAAISFEAGYYAEVLGEYAELERGRQRITSGALISVIAILLLPHAVFDSFRIGLMIFLSLPAALIGGVAGTLLSGGVLSLGSWIGFITVLGISARNGIMLISHYRHLEIEENVAFGRELILRGAEERLAPILTTTLTTWLALLPLAAPSSRSRAAANPAP